MNIKSKVRILLMASLLIGSSAVYADDELDVTMRMVPPGAELPDAVTKVITLPEQTPDSAKSNAQKGLDQANSVRQGVELPQVELPPQVDLPDPPKGRGPN